tara:strand:+ start:15526 stop:15639 length:114 start_codon:yes stop_codon:yes gene_type:complete
MHGILLHNDMIAKSKTAEAGGKITANIRTRTNIITVV